MSFTEKLGVFFFLLGLAIVIFSAALPTPTDLQEAKVVTLAVFGVLTALFRLRDEDDMDLIVAGGVFLLSAIVINFVLSGVTGLSRVLIALANMAFFVAAMLVVDTLIVVFRIASQHEKTSFSALARKHEQSRISLWDTIMLVSVVLVLVMLVLEIFFDTTAYQETLIALDYIILGLFAIDLVILYRKSLGPKDFLKTNWPDIIAIIPLSSVFRLTKLARFIRIVRILNRTRKASKILKVNRAAKFFSKKSGFNTYITPKKKKAASKKTAKSSSKSRKRK